MVDIASSKNPQELFEELCEENEALKAIILGATLTITIGESEKKQLLVKELLATRNHSLDTSCIISTDDDDDDHHNISCNASSPGQLNSIKKETKNQEDVQTTEDTSNIDNDAVQVLATASTERPVFYKRDFMSVLEEKNQWKEKADQLEEELEEWKRAALEAQEKVESLESEIEEVHQRVGGFYYPNEIQAKVLGMLPKGVNFRPYTSAEAAEIYVTDVEVSGCVQQDSKFLFAIKVTWSDKKCFEIYRRYGEFFTLQNTLVLLYPVEAGKSKTSERLIPSLPTADNVLAIFGATNSKSAIESRLQLIDNYCNTILLQLPKKISRSPLLFDFFRARPSDKQLESLQRPIRHSMELLVYPLMPEGQSRGLYVAIANYDASKEKNKSNKVSLEARESVRVVSEDSSGWWYVQKIESGECGFVPASFIKKIGDPSIPDASIDMGVLGFLTSVVANNDTNSSSQQLGDNEYIDPDLKYYATWDYETTDQRQLSFPEGAVIVIIDRSEDGWWFGTFDGKEGWVPSTYLKPCSDHNDANDDKKNEIVGQEYITSQNYTAKDEDEISLPSGVKVQVLEKSLTGWWKVKYRNRIGYAPATMLKQSFLPVSPEETTPVHQSLLFSMSGIRKPPPRRKHIDRKKRAQTFIVPIEEKEEPEITATTICDHEAMKVRRTSIKDMLRRGTHDSSVKTKPKRDSQSPNNRRKSLSAIVGIKKKTK